MDKVEQVVIEDKVGNQIGSHVQNTIQGTIIRQFAATVFCVAYQFIHCNRDHTNYTCSRKCMRSMSVSDWNLGFVLYCRV